MDMIGKEKVVKLHFYAQDLRVSHVTPTVYEVAAASITAKSPKGFGSIHVVDDLLTAEPESNSRAVGRLQGLTTNADMSAYGIAMNLNFSFTEGKFSGSTLCILGRNPVEEPQRELPIVGGTGAFRFARGYAIQKTYSIDFDTDYAVLEYTIYTTYDSKIGGFDDADVEVAEWGICGMFLHCIGGVFFRCFGIRFNNIK